jgi:hypothetical protein
MVSDDKLTALNAAVAEYGQAKFDEGAASVVAPTQPSQPAPTEPTPGAPSEPSAPVQSGFTQEEVDAKIAAALAERDASDKTTLTPEDATKMVDEATSALKAEIADLQLKLSQKDADALEEAIADQLATLAQSLRERTVKSAPVDETPKEEIPAEETPAEETPVETAPVETPEEKAARIASGK